MFKFLRKIIPDTHPFRLFYHRIVAMAAAIFYWFPADKMTVIGVTGTNGKTTTVNLITNILNNAGHKVGMSSSIRFQVGEDKWVNNSKQTTLGPFFFQKLLKRMVKEGCKYAVLEVTSHALTQSRVWGVNFDVAVLTNVIGDHIEYHGSFNNYLNAKGKLFKMNGKGKRKAGINKVNVLNADEKRFSFFDQFPVDRKISYGLKLATVYAEKIEKQPEGSKFVLHVPNHATDVKLNIPGEFNVYNALAATSACLALQVPLEKIKEGLESSGTIPGRYEHVDLGQKFSVIVDYAHTEDALENLFSLYRQLTKGRLFVVFGATGGGRDKSKRPRMGEIAEQYGDYILVTDDDPYSEEEIDIIDQIGEGVSRKEGENYWKIPDRREAIRLALTLAKEGDTVVVAGKGAEEVMKVRGRTVPWNDKKVVEELLERDIHIDLKENEWVKRAGESV